MSVNFRCTRSWMAVLVVLCCPHHRVQALQAAQHRPFAFFASSRFSTATPWSLLSATTQDEIVTEDDSSLSKGGTKPCFYRPAPDAWWKQRLNIEDLHVGQQLNGTVVQQLLNAKTGPKLFFECGVGRIDSKGNWQIVNGMLRFYKSSTKKSVVKKKAERFRKRGQVELFVSRVELDSGRFEVCTTLEAAEEFNRNHKQRVRASTLVPKQEVVGTVVKILPYGVMVDVDANRNGLLHIQKVADLYGTYIDKQAGLEKAGLEVGAKLRLSVLSNQRKRLELDFTPDVKLAAEEDRKQEEEAKLKLVDAEKATILEETQEEEAEKEDPYDISEEEAAMWANYAGDDNEAEEYDEYDEDRDIEDSLGLGGY